MVKELYLDHVVNRIETGSYKQIPRAQRLYRHWRLKPLFFNCDLYTAHDKNL